MDPFYPKFIIYEDHFAFRNPKQVDMALKKETKPNQTKPNEEKKTTVIS